LTTAAPHYAAARGRAGGVRAALLAVREGLAWEVAGERDSAAAAYAAARAAGLSSIDPWLRVRQARVTRDTAAAFRLLADLPPAAAREAGAAGPPTPGSRSSVRSAKVIRAPPRWCLRVSSWPARAATATRNGRIAPPPATPLSGRSRSTAARASSRGSGTLGHPRPCPASRSRFLPTPRRPPPSTCWATCWPTGATGEGPRAGSAS